MKKSFRNKLSKFLSTSPASTGGNVAITFALTLVPLLAAAGSAIDFGRYVAARNNVQTTADAAVLAGTRAFADTNDLSKSVAMADAYYKSQIKDKAYNLIKNDVTFSLNSGKNGLMATGDVVMKTSFMAAVGIDSLSIMTTAFGQFSVAQAAPSPKVEVAMMLDVTGSMCLNGSGPCSSDPKIAAVKTASTSLIDTVASLNKSKPTARIALVPFATAVKVETDGNAGSLMKALTNLDPTRSGFQDQWSCTGGSSSGSEHSGTGGSCKKVSTNYVNLKLAPCVTDRAFNASGAIDVSDNAPSSNAWLNSMDGSRMPKSWDSSDNAPTSGFGVTAADPMQGWAYNTSGKCWDVADGNTMMPLTDNASALKSRISTLQAYGATAGALGTTMTRFTLSPKFASVWGATAAPASYADIKTNKVRKIAVLMTDGGYNSYRSWKDQNITFVSKAAKDTCANMKQDGVEVFAVAFNFDSLSPAEAAAGQDTMTNCATDALHYFKADKNADLVAAFDTIAKSIADANPRLTN